MSPIRPPASDIPEATALVPALTPHGRLHLAPAEDAPTLGRDVGARLRAAFDRGAGHGLLQLGAGEVATALPAVYSYWRELGSLFVTALCTTPAAEGEAASPAPPRTELGALAAAAPPMTGAEYLTPAVFESLWDEMAAALREERARTRLGTQELLRRWSPAWNLVGRVWFHLAEKKGDDRNPFAFLATYTAAPLGDGQRAAPAARARRCRSTPARGEKERLSRSSCPSSGRPGAAPGAGSRRLGRDLPPLRFSPQRGAPSCCATSRSSRSAASWFAFRTGGTGAAPAAAAVSVTVGGKAPAGSRAEALLDFSRRADPRRGDAR